MICIGDWGEGLGRGSGAWDNGWVMWKKGGWLCGRGLSELCARYGI